MKQKRMQLMNLEEDFAAYEEQIELGQKAQKKEGPAVKRTKTEHFDRENNIEQRIKANN